MQKFCIFAGWLEDVGCRNSAQPYLRVIHYCTDNKWMQKFCMTFFPLNSLPYLQQMNDAEILHLKSVA